MQPLPRVWRGQVHLAVYAVTFPNSRPTTEGGGDGERVMDRERRFPHCDRICHITGFCEDQQNVLRPGRRQQHSRQCFSERKLTL